MALITSELKGYKKLQKKLKKAEKLGIDIQEDVEDAAIEIQNMAKKLAQEQGIWDTGHLVRSIDFEGGTNGYTVTSEAIKNNHDYAPYQEYGTRYTKPRPYFRPASEEGIENLKATINKRLKNATR